MMAYTFYSDAGHGWLKVPGSLLTSLGIADKISQYSYFRNGMVYLEEDCDMRILCQALADRRDGLVYVEAKPSTKASRIRSYDRYHACLLEEYCVRGAN